MRFRFSILIALLFGSSLAASLPLDVEVGYLGRVHLPDPAFFQAYKEDQTVGLVVSSRGNAEIHGQGSEVRPANLREEVRLGDTLVTDRHALLTVAFKDDSSLALAGNTEVQVKDYLFNSLGVEGRSRLKVKKGTFAFYAGKLSKMSPENYEVETEMATIGIRGSAGYGRLEVSDSGEPYLDVATQPGHVLVVTTRLGERYVVDNPRLGLRVFLHGLVLPIPITQGYFFQASGWSLEPIPVTFPGPGGSSPHDPFPPALLAVLPFDDRRSKSLAARIHQVMLRSLEETMLTYLIRSSDFRDIPEEGDLPPSPMQTMRRLAGVPQNHRHRDPLLDRESSCARGVLERLALEEKKAHKAPSPPKRA